VVSKFCTRVEKEPLSTFRAAVLDACEDEIAAIEPVIPNTNPNPEPPMPFPNLNSNSSILA